MNPLRRRGSGAAEWVRELAHDDAGDVPGWVLVTLVTVS